MKKLFTQLTLSLSLCIAFAAPAAHAQLSIIPKPDTLPGPDLGAEVALSENGECPKDYLLQPDSENDSRPCIPFASTRTFTENVLPNIAIGLIGFVGAAALVFLMVAGIRYATSYGVEEATEKAKSQIIYSLFGLLIAILSYTIVTIIINLQFEGDQTQREAAPQQTYEESRQTIRGLIDDLDPNDPNYAQRRAQLEDSLNKIDEFEELGRSAEDLGEELNRTLNQ